MGVLTDIPAVRARAISGAGGTPTLAYPSGFEGLMIVTEYGTRNRRVYESDIYKNEESIDFPDKAVARQNALISVTYSAYFLGNADKSLEYNDIWIY